MRFGYHCEIVLGRVTFFGVTCYRVDEVVYTDAGSPRRGTQESFALCKGEQAIRDAMAANREGIRVSIIADQYQAADLAIRVGLDKLPDDQIHVKEGRPSFDIRAWITTELVDVEPFEWELHLMVTKDDPFKISHTLVSQTLSV